MQLSSFYPGPGERDERDEGEWVRHLSVIKKHSFSFYSFRTFSLLQNVLEATLGSINL